MKQAYGDYAMAVIIGRAIPNLYDGLKPVTRRLVLTAMKWLNLKPDGKLYEMLLSVELAKPWANLHPNGGCYGTLIGMTQSQWWTLNNPILMSTDMATWVQS